MSAHANLRHAGLLGLAEQAAIELGISLDALLSRTAEPHVVAAQGVFWEAIRSARRDLTWTEIGTILDRDPAVVIEWAMRVRLAGRQTDAEQASVAVLEHDGDY